MNNENYCDNCEHFNFGSQICNISKIYKNKDLYIERLAIIANKYEINRKEVLKRLTKEDKNEYKVTITKL